MANYLLGQGKIPYIPQRVYTCIYAALSSDTGCFKYANVTQRTHIIASELVDVGIDTSDINHKLFDSKSLKQIKAEGEAARRLAVYEQGRVASVTFPYASKFSLGLKEEHLETIIEIPRSLAGVEVAFAVRQPEDKNVFRVSMRSNGEFDVAKICAAFGGGGHSKAAGCTIEGGGIYDVEKLILTAVQKLLS